MGVPRTGLWFRKGKVIISRSNIFPGRFSVESCGHENEFEEVRVVAMKYKKKYTILDRKYTILERKYTILTIRLADHVSIQLISLLTNGTGEICRVGICQ